MKNLCTNLAVLLLQLWSLGFANGQSEYADVSAEREQIHCANNQGWKSGEFLLTETKFHRGPKVDATLPDSSIKKMRCAIDWEKGVIFCLARYTKEFEGAEEKSGSAAKGKSQMYFQTRTEKDGRNLAVANKALVIREVLFSSEIPLPEIRLIGTGEYSGDYPSLSFDDYCNKVARGMIPRLDGVVSRSKEGITLSRTMQETHTIAESFSGVSMMKTSIVIRKKDSLSVSLDESYTWMDVDGIYVPTSVSKERNFLQPLCSDYTTVEILWRSLNKPIDPKLFEIPVNGDVKRQVQLLDEELFKQEGCLNTK